MPLRGALFRIHHTRPQVELKLAAAQSELDAAKQEVASRDESSAESKSQAEAAAARLQVYIIWRGIVRSW